jgi:hypothetical protein
MRKVWLALVGAAAIIPAPAVALEFCNRVREGVGRHSDYHERSAAGGISPATC